MNSRLRQLFGSGFLLLTVVCVPSVYGESGALIHLQTRITSLQQVLRDPKLAGKQRSFQRRKIERVIFMQLFDFQEMARRSLGRDASQYSDRLNEFTPLFIDFLEHLYMETLEENGDAIIRYINERVRGEQAQSDTRTQLRNGREYRVDYKLVQTSAGWRVYDVVVEDISLVENYRSQFERVLRRKSFDELLQDLREKKGTFN